MSNEPQTPTPLTEYESLQVEQIAAWKSAFPNPFGELIRRVAHPVLKIVEIIIPERMAIRCIKMAYHAADAAAVVDDVKRTAGVADISELRHKPLEECDRLSRQVGTHAQGLATVEGALTGAGGVFTTVLDIPLLFTLCLRTIIKTGHCYGYILNRPTDKAWVLGVFAVALSHTKQKRVQLTARLRDIEDLMIEDTQQQIVVDEAISLLAQLEVFESIPLVGVITGAWFNLSSTHKMETTARRLFQERWLRDNGKKYEVEPAPEQEKVLTRHGWSGAFARAGNSTLFGLGFGAAFPVYFVAEMWQAIGRPRASTVSRTGDSAA